MKFQPGYDQGKLPTPCQLQYPYSDLGEVNVLESDSVQGIVRFSHYNYFWSLQVTLKNTPLLT